MVCSTFMLQGFRREKSEDTRRFPGERRYMLGVETAIQKMRWTEDGWLMPESGTPVPQILVDVPNLPEVCFPGSRTETILKIPASGKDYQSLRIPMDSNFISLTEGRDIFGCMGEAAWHPAFKQTLIARRMTEYTCEAAACLEFELEVFKQMAGLILMYDTDNYLYLHISHDEDAGKCVTLLKAENRSYCYLTDYIPVKGRKTGYTEVFCEGNRALFFYQEEGKMSGASLLSGTSASCRMKPVRKDGLPEPCAAFAARILQVKEGTRILTGLR